MATCKNCGATIHGDSKICERCGIINPIKQKKVRTIDLTLVGDKEEFSGINKISQPKSRKLVLLYYIIGGFFGLPYFYLGKVRNGILAIVSHLIMIGAGFGLSFAFKYYNYLVISLCLIGLILIINLILGLINFFNQDLLDAKGDAVF